MGCGVLYASIYCVCTDVQYRTLLSECAQIKLVIVFMVYYYGNHFAHSLESWMRNTFAVGISVGDNNSSCLVNTITEAYTPVLDGVLNPQ